jgi:hypothetical protein
MKVLTAFLKWITQQSGVAAQSSSHLGRTWFESRPGHRLSLQEFHLYLRANTCFQILAEVINEDKFLQLTCYTANAVEMASLYCLINSHLYSTYTRSPFTEHLSDYKSTCSFFQHHGATSQTANCFQRLMTRQIKEGRNRLLMITYEQYYVYTPDLYRFYLLV